MHSRDRLLVWSTEKAQGLVTVRLPVRFVKHSSVCFADCWCSDSVSGEIAKVVPHKLGRSVDRSRCDASAYRAFIQHVPIRPVPAWIIQTIGDVIHIGRDAARMCKITDVSLSGTFGRLS